MSKLDVVTKFNEDITMAERAWNRHRVNPYSDKYIDSFNTYKKVLALRDKDLQMQREIFITVAILAGSALIAFAPAAAVIAAGSRGVTLGIFRASGVLARSGLLAKLATNRAAAFKVMKKIVYGGADWIKALAKGPGKKILEARIDAEMSYPANSSSGPDDPLMHKNKLQNGVLAMSEELTKLAQRVRDTRDVSEGDARTIFRLVFEHSPYFQQAPTDWGGDHPLAGRKRPQTPAWEDVRRNMELTMWATWLIGLRYSQTVYSGGGMYSFTPPTSRQVTRYKKPGGRVETHLSEKLGVLITRSDGRKVSVSDFCGWYTTEDEVSKLVSWAERYVKDRASKQSKHLISPM